MHKEKGKNIENPMEEKSETLIQRKKGKCSSQPTEGKQEIPVQKGKDKGTKIPLERKEETLVKHFEENVIINEETTMQRKKGKRKTTQKPDEVDKTFPI